MEHVKAHFIHDKQEDHHTYGNANSQPKDIDDGKGFILHQIPPGDLKVVLDHSVECEGLKLPRNQCQPSFSFAISYLTQLLPPQLSVFDTPYVRNKFLT